MISCQDYDYVEIACLFQYPLQLKLKTGKNVEGTAIDTKRNEFGQECIELKKDDRPLLIILDDIEVISTLIDNPHFKSVRFG